METRDKLKGYFKTGEYPTEEQFSELVDAIYDSDAFVVKVTRKRKTVSFDKTYNEIVLAHREGRRIEFLINEDIKVNNFAISDSLGSTAQGYITVYAFNNLVMTVYTWLEGFDAPTARDYTLADESDVEDLQEQIDSKQDTLVSKKNIKTINGQSILGAGNIVVQGGGGGAEDFPVNISVTQSSCVFRVPYNEIIRAYAEGKMLRFVVNGNNCLHGYEINEAAAHNNIKVYQIDTPSITEYILFEPNEEGRSETSLRKFVCAEKDINRVLKYNLGDLRKNANANCTGLVLYSPGLAGTQYLGIQNQAQYIKSFSVYSAGKSGQYPANKAYYLVVAKQINGGAWLAQACSTNAINMSQYAENTMLTWDFSGDDAISCPSSGNCGVVTILSETKRNIGDNMGAEANWPVLRIKIQTNVNANANKCVMLNYNEWHDQTWQASHQIEFVAEIPEIPTSNPDKVYGIKFDKGIKIEEPHVDLSGKQDVLVSGTNIKTVNGKSLLGSGNLVIGGRYEVLIQDSERGIFFTNETYESLLEKHQSANKLTFALPNGTTTGIYSIVFPADGLGKPYFSVVFNSGDETKEYALYVDNTAKKLRDGSSDGSFLITFKCDEYDHTSADKTIAQVIYAAQKGMTLKVKLVLAPEVSGDIKIATTMFTANCSLEHIYPASTLEDVDGNVPATIGDTYLYAYAQVHDTIYEVSLGNNYCNCRIINLF